MTTSSLYASTAQIRAEAAKLDPLKVLITLVLIVPYILGWTARIVWILIALLWTGGVYGWRKAQAQIEAREAAARGN